ncbi:hypothetical protein AAMO2058_000056200 [Amorphochlora amoebiformis]
MTTKISTLNHALLYRIWIYLGGRELCRSLALVCRRWREEISNSEELWRLIAYCKFMGGADGVHEDAYLSIKAGVDKAYNRFRLQSTQYSPFKRKRRREPSVAFVHYSRWNPNKIKCLNSKCGRKPTRMLTSVSSIPTWKSFYFETSHCAKIIDPKTLQLFLMRGYNRLSVQNFVAWIRELYIDFEKSVEEIKSDKTINTTRERYTLSFATLKPFQPLIVLNNTLSSQSYNTNQFQNYQPDEVEENVIRKLLLGENTSGIIVTGYDSSITEFARLIHRLRTKIYHRLKPNYSLLRCQHQISTFSQYRIFMNTFLAHVLLVYISL